MKVKHPEPGSVKQVFLFLAAIAVALVLFHGPLVWLGQVLCGGDLVNQFYPMRKGQLERGWFAGWQPETFSGRPFTGEPQSGAFYPPNWLHLVFPSIPKTETALVMLHLVAGALGFFLFLRRRFSGAAAALAALLWAFGGYQILRFTNGVNIFNLAMAWIPWMWWAAEMQQARWGRGLAWAGLLGLLGGLQITAGAAQIVQITWAGLAVWTLARIIWPGEGNNRLAIGSGFLIAAVLALGISSPYLRSVIQFQSEAFPRAQGDEWAFLSDGSLPPRMIWTWIFPHLYAPSPNDELHWGSAVGYAETGIYLGVLPLFLAIFALASWGWRGLAVRMKAPAERSADRWMLTLLFLAVTAFLISLGRFGFLFKPLTVLVPTFDLFRVPARWLLWVELGLIVLAAWGFDALLKGRKDHPDSPARGPLIRWSLCAGIPLLLFAVAWIGTRPLLMALGLGDMAATRPAPFQAAFLNELLGLARKSIMTGLVLGLVGSALAGLILSGKYSAKSLAALLGLVITIDLLVFWLPYTSPIPAGRPPTQIRNEGNHHRISADYFEDYFYPPTPLIDRGQEAAGRVFYDNTLNFYQVDQFQREFLNERPMWHGIELARGYQQIHLESYIDDFFSSFEKPGSARAGDALLLHGAMEDRRFLDAYNVSAFFAYRNENVFEQYREKGLAEFQPLTEQGLFQITNPGARGWAWLSPEEEFLDAEADAELGTVELEERAPEHWRATATVKRPAFFHFSSPDFGAWKLTAVSDGGQIIEGIDSRTIRLPQGRWTVERVYETAGFRGGWLALCALSLLAAGAMIGMGLGRVKKG